MGSIGYKKKLLWLIYVVKNNNNRIEVFRVKKVVFGISLSVIKVLFSLTEYSLSCSFSVRSPDIG